METRKNEVKAYEEIIGTYENLKVDEDKITLTLSVNKNVKIAFPTKSPEANILIKALKNTPKGAKLAIVKTNLPRKPLIVKIVNG